MSGIQTADQERPTLRNWLSVATVAIGIFIFVTTEMLPVGVLPAIGAALNVSDGTVGLTVTVPAIVAAFTGPLLTVATGRLDRRLMLCVLLALLAAGNLISAMASSFPVLLGARILVGLSIGGFWSIAAAIAVRLVPPAAVGRATALIFSGVATASVVGVPAGTLIGDIGGWRSAFIAAGLLSLLVLVAMVTLLPRLPAKQTIRLGALPSLLGNATLRMGLLATFLLITGHFSAYTFVSPFLQQVSGIDGNLISSLLLVYGTAGIIGNFVAGPAAVRNVRRTLLLIVGGITVSLLLMSLFGNEPVGGIAFLVAWGLTYGGVSVSLQTWMLKIAPHAMEAASALYVAVFNLSISLGALVGGQAVDNIGTASVTWLGGGLVLLSAAAIWSAKTKEAQPQ